MKYALISDVHANLPALEAVLADIRTRVDVTATYHLGDLVGYAPWPNETVNLIQSRGIAGVAGNYDSTVGTDYKHCGCRYEDPRQEELSHISYTWTREHVSPSTKQFLAGLPFRIDLLPMGGHLTGPRVVLVHGTHIPWHREVSGIHFVNTGSAGRPKDGDWRAGYVVLEVGSGAVQVDVIRVEYDLEKAVTAIRKSELPDDFAEYLRVGGQPAAAPAQP
jgi:predicted phosphodiesterase